MKRAALHAPAGLCSCAALAAVAAEPGAWRLSGYATLGHAELRSNSARTVARDQTQSQSRGWEVDGRVGHHRRQALRVQRAARAQLVVGEQAAFARQVLGLQRATGDWQLTEEWSRTRGKAKQTTGVRHHRRLARRIDACTHFVAVERSRMVEPALSAPPDWQAQLAPLVGPQLAAQAAALGIGAAHAGKNGEATPEGALKASP
ncbi:MAG: hypothetical protein ACK4F7_06620 [Inhella sp.]